MSTDASKMTRDLRVDGDIERRCARCMAIDRAGWFREQNHMHVHDRSGHVPDVVMNLDYSRDVEGVTHIVLHRGHRDIASTGPGSEDYSFMKILADRFWGRYSRRVLYGCSVAP